MPVAGRKPKEGPKRNRMPPTHDWVEVEDVPFEDAPRPKEYRGWPAGTKRWWDAVSTMPHCKLWRPSDWQFAIDTGNTHRMATLGDTPRYTELRMREKILGTTMDARRDLRIRYVPPEMEQMLEESPSAVTSIDSRRRRDFDAT